MKDIKMAWALVAVFIFASVSSFADTSAKIEQATILRNANGIMRFMSQHDALTACPSGSHLPTARELALMAQASGAKGIIEINAAPDGEPLGYDLIDVTNSDGTRDRFYYNNDGYRSPKKGSDDNEYFWSSSIMNSSESIIGVASNEIKGLPYAIVGLEGTMFPAFGLGSFDLPDVGVRCMSNEATKIESSNLNSQNPRVIADRVTAKSPMNGSVDGQLSSDHTAISAQ